MSNDKVIFNREQSDAFIWLQQSSSFSTEYMVGVITGPTELSGNLLPLQSVSQHDLLKAVFNGFELQKSPAEQLASEIQTITMTGECEEDGVCTTRETIAYLTGLKKAAQIFGVPYSI